MRREPNPSDGRGTLAVITDAGREVAAKATEEFHAGQFALGALDLDALDAVFATLRRLRENAGDFV